MSSNQDTSDAPTGKTPCGVCDGYNAPDRSWHRQGCPNEPTYVQVGEAPVSAEAKPIEGGVTCRFCAKTVGEAAVLVVPGKHDPLSGICDECIRVCAEILEEKETPRSAEATPIGDVMKAAKTLLDEWQNKHTVALAPGARNDLINSIASRLWGLRPTTIEDLRRERATPVAVTGHEVQEALAVVNDHFGFGGAITHAGTELKGRTPDGEGDFSKTYLSSGDCEELANAFYVLSVRLAKKEGT